MDKVKSPKKRKSSQAAGTCDDSGGSVAAAPDTGTAPKPVSAHSDAVDTALHLEHGLEIKDVEAAHRRLSAALARGLAVTVDMSLIGAVDTAGIQLLLALRSEAVRRGVPMEFRGESAAVTQALAVLGLPGALRTASAHG